MIGHPVGPEREDRVGLDVRDELADALIALVRQAGVHVDVPHVEPDVFVDAQDLQAPFELLRPDLTHRLGGHFSSSIDPPSPRVAVTQTTREPLRTARAMIPAVR